MSNLFNLIVAMGLGLPLIASTAAAQSMPNSPDIKNKTVASYADVPMHKWQRLAPATRFHIPNVLVEEFGLATRDDTDKRSNLSKFVGECLDACAVDVRFEDRPMRESWNYCIERSRNRR